MERKDTGVEQIHTAELLEKINGLRKRLGSRGRQVALPDSLPEYEPLKGKKVLLVEDVEGIIENHLADCVVATDGNTDFIHYTNQALDQLAEDIISRDPDIILLDYHLSDDLKGIDVIRKLQELGFAGRIVGYSSERERAKEFKLAGVDSIEKGGYSSETLKTLAALV